MFVGFGDDWRMTMEEYAAANLKFVPRLPWTNGIPFGWNSWGVIQQYISYDETWLDRNAPTTAGYQETLEELLALQSYVAELHAQFACLDEVALELALEREHWRNPALLLAS